MEYLGLFIEIIFLVMATYLYLFAIGKIKTKDKTKAAKAEAFRQDNHWWLRLAALALMAVMSFNLYLHVKSILAG